MHVVFFKSANLCGSLIRVLLEPDLVSDPDSQLLQLL
jgi:hypothetical protein